MDLSLTLNLDCNYRRLLWALCLIFSFLGAIGAAPAKAYVGERSFEFPVNKSFWFRADVKEVLENANLRPVGLRHECDAPITFYMGKCGRNYYGTTESHRDFSIVFKPSNVPTLLKLVDSECVPGQVEDHTLHFRIFSTGETTCKFTLFHVHHPVDWFRFRMFQVNGSELILYEEIADRNKASHGPDLIIVLLIILSAILGLSAFLARCLIADALGDDVELVDVEEVAQNNEYADREDAASTASEKPAEDEVDAVQKSNNVEEHASIQETAETDNVATTENAANDKDEKTVLDQYELKYIDDDN